MGSPTVQLSTGTTIAFATSGFTANIIAFASPGFTRETRDIAHLGTTGPRPKLASDLHTLESLKMQVFFNPDIVPAKNGPPETVTITYPSGSAWIFQGVVTDFTPDNAALEEVMKASMTVAVMGGITTTTGTTSTTGA